jgi:hypothetical protein
MHVFEGDFTIEMDKVKLVDPVLSLWAHAYVAKDDLYQLVEKHRAAIFPRAYFEDLVEILEAEIDKGHGGNSTETSDSSFGEVSTYHKVQKVQTRRKMSLEMRAEASTSRDLNMQAEASRSRSVSPLKTGSVIAALARSAGAWSTGGSSSSAALRSTVSVSVLPDQAQHSI